MIKWIILLLGLITPSLGRAEEWQAELQTVLDALDMTALEKTVFLADYISAERDFEGVDAVREAVKTGGDEACRLALAQTIASLTQRGSYIEEHTIEAYNFLVCALADKAAL